MSTEAEQSDLQRSALDLLDSGNGVHSVAVVLGVPIDVVERWSREPRLAMSRAMPVALPVVVPPGALSIEPTGFIALPFVARVLSVFIPLFFLVLAAALDLPAVMRKADLQWLWALIVIGGLALAVFTMAFGLRSGFELTARGVAWQGAWRRRELAYADLLDGRIAWSSNSGRYMLTLRARSGASGGTIWLTSEQVCQLGIAKWIASLRRPGDERFIPTMPVDDADEGGFLNGLVKVLMVLRVLCFAVICFLQGQILAKDLHLLRHGPTPFDALTVTEGALVRLDPCYRPRRGTPSQAVKIETATGVEQFGLPCLIPRASYDKPGFRHIVIRHDEQSFGDHEIYSVELDGVALQSYASHAAFRRSFAGSSALMHVLILGLTGIATIVLFRALPFRTRR